MNDTHSAITPFVRNKVSVRNLTAESPSLVQLQLVRISSGSQITCVNPSKHWRGSSGGYGDLPLHHLMKEYMADRASCPQEHRCGQHHLHHHAAFPVEVGYMAVASCFCSHCFACWDVS